MKDVRVHFPDYSISDIIKAVATRGIGLFVAVVLMPIWLPILIAYKAIAFIGNMFVDMWTLSMFEAKVIMVVIVIIAMLM